MAYGSTSPTTAESRLRQAIGEYTQAQERGQFLEAVFSVHAALEGALDAGLDAQEIQDLSFVQKFQRVLPEIGQRAIVGRLNLQRNDYAHPRRRYETNEYLETARGLVDLACDAWPQLFASPPPVVRHPGLSRPAGQQPSAQAIRQWETLRQLVRERGRELRGRFARVTGGSSVAKTKRVLPWRDLGLVLLLLLFILLLNRFAYPYWQSSGATRYLAVLATAVILVLVFFIMRHLARFLRSLGAGRLADVAAVVLTLAVLALMPYTGIVPSRPPVTRVPGASPTPTGGINIGMRVVVRTDGAPLISRTEPGRNQMVAARFASGTELAVIGGPTQAEGLTWWKVEGQSGSGWGAAIFLVPVASP